MTVWKGIFRVGQLDIEANKFAFVDKNQLLVIREGNFCYNCKTFNCNQYYICPQD